MCRACGRQIIRGRACGNTRRGRGHWRTGPIVGARFNRTGKVDDGKLEKVLAELFPLRPTNIRRTLKLNRPIYRRTAAYGHFGRAPDKDGGFSWEKTDLADQIRKAVK